MATRRSRGQRAGLSHERVLTAARAALAEGGLEALTMRALADRLEVHPNALYSHVASKDALLDDVLDDVLAEVDAPGASAADPHAGLHRIMTSTFEVLLAHPDLVPLYLARQGARGPNAQRLGEVMRTLLAAGGIEGEAAHEARRVLIVYTIGFAAFVAHPSLEAPQATPRRAELEANFRRGLDWLLAGAGLGVSSGARKPRAR